MTMEVKALLQQYGLRPRKELGQNFLINARVLEIILAAAEVGTQDTVLEVGSGLGVLTQALAERARRVVTVEVDKQLVEILQHRLRRFPNVEIVLGDILTLDICQLLQDKHAHRISPYKRCRR